MGAANVGAAFVVGKDLSHSAKLVLLRMALVSLDADKPPRYFAGWELLALSLGYDVPPSTDTSPAAKKSRDGIRRNVRRAVKELEASGLISSPWGIESRARVGRRAEYHLHLDALARVTSPTTLTVSPNELEGDVSDHPEGDVSDHPGGWSEVVVEGDVSDHPKEKQEPVPGARSGTIPSLVGNVTSARETASTADDEEYAEARTFLITQGPTIHDLVNEVMATHGIDRREAVIEVARTLRKKGTAA